MQENVQLEAFNTFGLGARAQYFCSVQSRKQLQDALAFATERHLPVFVLGGGSNILLRDDVPGLVLHMQIKGVSLLGEQDGAVRVQAACGESWHSFVSACLAHGWHGLENLALIPGSVGAAPVQNIGAYGVEVGDLIAHVNVLDVATGRLEQMSAAQCEFGYRDSVFKRQHKGSKIILDVVFHLHRTATVDLSYGALAQALSGNPAPQPADLFAAVCAIRRSKLPDPAVLGNAGSFFKNPVVTGSQYASLQQQFADIPGHPAQLEGSSGVKIPAAWLIERAGWKGRRLGDAGVYEKQPLVLVNLGHASAQDLLGLAFEIMHDVEQEFGIVLEPEVQLVPALDSCD